MGDNMKKYIKTLLVIGVLIVVGTSCGKKESGQLIGVLDRPSWKGINPYGMVYIPSGTLHIGAGDQDVRSTFVQRPKAISITGFYMDDTEITNNEYRQFVFWVRDSVLHSWMDHYIEDEVTGEQYIDWDQEIDWSDETVQDIYYQGDMAFGNRKEINIEKLNFEFQWKDWNRMSHDRNPNNRTKYIHKDKTRIYPDTLCWIRDFAYSYNEPMTRNYFSHPAYDDYPVVGVDWKMANAFNYWRTNLWNTYNEEGINTEDFRLPTEYEWEYAARGGHDLAPYPWGGYYIRNAKGCLLANFKPGRGNYPEDGGLYTVRADAYFPNDYGLYCMAGNVAEWTNSPFDENAYSFIHDLNPNIQYDAQEEDPIAFKRKVIRGGSWKDIGHFLQNSTRHWEFQDTAKSYIGFRSALTFLGRSMNDF